MATTYYRYNALTRVLTAEPRYIVTIERPDADRFFRFAETGSLS